MDHQNKPVVWVPAHVLAEIGEFGTWLQARARSSTGFASGVFTRELDTVILQTSCKRENDPNQGVLPLVGGEYPRR